MGQLTHLFYPWGLILQAFAILHFIRRRPDTYWLYIILFIGPIGALIYLVAEASPDFALVGPAFKVFPRRKRIKQLEALVRDNPSLGNLEELGDLYFEDGKLAQARDAFDRAIAARADTLDPFYRRALCALQLNDPAAALQPRHRVAGACLRADRADRARRNDLPPHHPDFHALRNLPQFRLAAERSGQACGGEGLGAESAGQETDDAGLSAPPRAALVSFGQRDAQASASLTGWRFGLH